MQNTNLITGVRYGVISLNSLDGDLAHELQHGPDAVDLTYQAAFNEEKERLEKEWGQELEEAQIAASENGCKSDYVSEEFIDKWMMEKMGENSMDEYVDQALEAWSDQADFEEPTIEGTYEGVKYQISYLGGAPLLWVCDGPIGYAARLCSPCVPNAADLDSTFSLEEDLVDGDEMFHRCYVVPRDWLAAVPA